MASCFQHAHVRIYPPVFGERSADRSAPCFDVDEALVNIGCFRHVAETANVHHCLANARIANKIVGTKLEVSQLKANGHIRTTNAADAMNVTHPDLIIYRQQN